MSSQKKTHHWAEAIQRKLLPSEQLEKPVSLSLIIPVYNCSQSISETLESVRMQHYSPLEVIVVDAGSTDRTLEIVNSYASLINRVYTVTTFNLPDMIDRGVSIASSNYISFLFPGSFYLSTFIYRTFAQEVIERDFPDLVYCGSVQRERGQDPQYVFHPFDVHLLERGSHLASLPACWFRADLFSRAGKFNARYSVRFGYDFFCRISKKKELRVGPIERIFVDFDYGSFTYGKAFRFFAETWQILTTHFGFKKTLRWLLGLNYLQMIKGLWRVLKHQLFVRR
ncbi:MAG: glycosyltransferase [Chlamydiales bacterium]